MNRLKIGFLVPLELHSRQMFACLEDVLLVVLYISIRIITIKNIIIIEIDNKTNNKVQN